MALNFLFEDKDNETAKGPESIWFVRAPAPSANPQQGTQHFQQSLDDSQKEFCTKWIKTPDVKAAYTFVQSVACNYKPDETNFLNQIFKCNDPAAKNPICEKLPEYTGFACAMLKTPYDQFMQDICTAKSKECSGNNLCAANSKDLSLNSVCDKDFFSVNFEVPPVGLSKSAAKWCKERKDSKKKSKPTPP